MSGKITRGIGEHGQEVMFLDGERIPSVSGLFKTLGVDADLSGVPKKILERAIEIGNKVHNYLETRHADLVDDMIFEDDKEVEGCLLSFHKWIKKSGAKLIEGSQEKTEENEIIDGQHLMARCDAIYTIDGVDVAVDYKTSAKIYQTAKLQVTAQQFIFGCHAGATLQLFKDGRIGVLKEWDESELLRKMLAIYRDNDDLDRILKGQALLDYSEPIPKELAEDYEFIKTELATMQKKEKELKTKITEILGQQKGSYENERYKLTFSLVAGKTTTKYDYDKMIADGVDLEKYKTTTQGKAYYKASVKEVKC